MHKGKLIATILLICIIILTGCRKTIKYSEKYEGIPIYPRLELKESAPFVEKYENSDFGGTFEEAKEFYTHNTDQEKWEIRQNPLIKGETKSKEGIVEASGVQGYLLKNKIKDEEVSLLITYWKIQNMKGNLRITIDGRPLKEGKFIAKGRSNHWEASMEYVITRGTVSVEGYIEYLGESPPKVVDYEFLWHQIMNGESIEKSIIDRGGKELKASKIHFSDKNDHREHKLERIKEGINNHAYIELKWKDGEEKKTEKIEFKIE